MHKVKVLLGQESTIPPVERGEACFIADTGDFTINDGNTNRLINEVKQSAIDDINNTIGDVQTLLDYVINQQSQILGSEGG